MVDDIAVMVNEFCRVVVALERELAAVGRADEPSARPLETLDVAVLAGLDLLGPMRPGFIAEVANLSTGGASKLVSRLERTGLVARVAGEVHGDRRAVEVVITDRGRDQVRAAEALVVQLAPDLIRSFRAVLLDGAAGATPGRDDPRGALPGAAVPAVAGPVLGQLIRFLVLADAAALTVVADIDVLHPNDPRGILVLSELDLRGSVRAGDVPELVGRSRAAASALVGRLDALGFLERRPDVTDGRGVDLGLTPVGRAVIRGVVAAVAADLATLRPAMADLVAELGQAVA